MHEHIRVFASACSALGENCDLIASAVELGQRQLTASDVTTRFALGSATVGVGVDGGVNALEFFYPRLSSGAYLFVHDYHNPESDSACRRAVEEFMADKPEGVIEIADMRGSVMFRKARAVDAAGQR